MERKSDYMANTKPDTWKYVIAFALTAVFCAGGGVFVGYPMGEHDGYLDGYEAGVESVEVEECECKECTDCTKYLEDLFDLCPDVECSPCVCECGEENPEPNENEVTRIVKHKDSYPSEGFLPGQQTPEQQEDLDAGRCEQVYVWWGARHTWYWVC